MYAIEYGILERKVGNRGIVLPAERSGKWALCKSVHDQLQCCGIVHCTALETIHLDSSSNNSKPKVSICVLKAR